MPTAEQLEALPLLDDFNREELGGLSFPWELLPWAEWLGSCYPTTGYISYPYFYPGFDVATRREDTELPDDCAAAIEINNPAEASGAVEVWLRMEYEVKAGWRLRATYEGGGNWNLRLSLWYEGSEYGEPYVWEEGGLALGNVECAIGLAIEGGMLTVWAQPQGLGWQELGGPGEVSAELEALPSHFGGIGIEGEEAAPAIRGYSAGPLEAEPPAPPANTLPPALTGTAEVGQKLECSTGSWSNEPTSYAYKWQRSATGEGGWANIGGAAASSYTATSEDFGQYLRCVVTATNADGSAEAASAASAKVKASISSTAHRPVSRPSLDLDVEVETSTGEFERLPSDSRIASRRPRIGLFRTQRGDGFATGSVGLARQIFREYADVGLLDTWRLIGRNGEVAYEGRLGAHPRVNDPQQQINANLVGWMTYLTGRKCGPLIIDGVTGHWQDPSTQRQANVLAANYQYQGSWSAAGRESGSQPPGIIQRFNRLATKESTGPYAHIETAYYGGGEEIGGILFDAIVLGAISPAAFWDQAVAFGADDVLGGYEFSIDYSGTPAAAQSRVAAAGKRYVFLGMNFLGSWTGDGDWAWLWGNPKVYGRHGLTLRGVWPEVGYYLSDIKRHVIQTYRPKITYRGETNTYVVKQATWHNNRSTPFEILQQLGDLDLWEQNVWENREFWNHPADLTKYDWVIRTDDPGVRVMFDGPSIENTANGIEVTYTDYSGIKRTLNPADHPELRDESDTNPANRHDEELYIEDEVPWPCLEAEALQFGRARLAEYIRPKRPATFRLAGGYIRDATARTWHQGWRVRNSQTLGVLDHPYDSPRLIYATSYDPATDTLEVTVDGPPRRMDAIVARQQRAREAANLA